MFMDCGKALMELKGTALEEACDRLGRFELYHLLFKPTMTDKLHTAEQFAFAPKDYLKWTQLCAGGSLQICELFGVRGEDRETGLKYGRYDAGQREAEKAGLPAGYHVFAEANFGDYYCFREPSDGTRDDCVYQWGLHEGEVVLVWDSFSDWLAEQVNMWVEMIADDELDPIGYKMEDHHE